MKVRHKRLTDSKEWQWELIDTLPPYYICYDRNGGPNVALPMQDYEPLPAEPRWVDCTEACGLEWDGNRITFPRGNGLSADLPNGYRARKITFSMASGQEGVTSYCAGEMPFAFIIERKA